MKKKIYHRRFNILDRKKKDPNKFVFTGESRDEKIDIQLFKYNADDFSETKNLSQDSVKPTKDQDRVHWLNIHGLSDPEAIARICKKLSIHNLVIQDILDINQRPKYQEFENYCFFTIKSIVPSDTEMFTEQISFVFGANYLVSFQERKGDYFEHLRFRIRENTGIIRERGADYLLFTMLESILDNYFKTLQQLDTDIEAFNTININSEPSPAMLETIEQNKRLVYIVRKSIQPIKDFIIIIEREGNKYIEKRNLKYFSEIKDLCLTLLDSCDTIESALESSTNLFFSIQGHRMNQVMKTLTIIATIFIPLTFIAGIYGMNFSNMPELEWKYGYFSVWALIFLIGFGMFLYLKRRKWF